MATSHLYSEIHYCNSLLLHHVATQTNCLQFVHKFATRAENKKLKRFILSLRFLKLLKLFNG